MSVTSCYEDLGNYEYKTLNDFELVFTPKVNFANGDLSYGEIKFPQPMGEDQVKEIQIDLLQTLETSDDNVGWRTILITGSGEEQIRDTTFNNETIELPFPANKLTSIALFIEVCDSTTMLKKYYSINAATRKLFLNSWFVVHGTSEDALKLGNVEDIEDEEIIVQPDAYNYANQEPLSINNYSGIWMNVDDIAHQNLILFDSDANPPAYNPYGLNTNLEMLDFPVGVHDFNPVKAVNTKVNKVLIDANGRYLHGRNLNVYYESQASSTISSSHVVNCAPIGMQGMTWIFWDDVLNKFLYETISMNWYHWGGDRSQSQINSSLEDANLNYNGLPSDAQLTDGSKTCIWMQGVGEEKGDVTQHALALFKNKSDNNMFLYRIELDEKGGKKGPKGDGKGGVSTNFTLTSSSVNLVNADEVNDKRIVVSKSLKDVFFYATGNTLYRHDIVANVSSPIYTLQIGDKIEAIKFRGGIENIDHTHLGVAVTKTDGSGQLHQVSITGSGDVNESEAIKIYEGFDEIRDIIFASNK